MSESIDGCILRNNLLRNISEVNDSENNLFFLKKEINDHGALK